MGIKYAVNEIKLDMANYRHYWRGQSKIGKTTLFRDLIMELYNDPTFGLLISVGQEIGYKSLDKITAIDCATWGDFVDVVDDLVENKSENNFKFLAIDTVDELTEIAERKVLDIHRATKQETASSINAALGGFGAGKKKARSLVEDQIAKLERAGYGMIYIGHTKVKDVTEKSTDVTYQQLTGSLEFAYDAIFADRADVMAMMITESSAKNGRLSDTSRYIYFRGTNFIDAGSRMSNLPERIVLNAKEYIVAINSALEKASNKSTAEADKIRKQEETIREKSAQEFSEKEKETNHPATELAFHTAEEIKEKILSLRKGLSKEDRELKKSELKRQNLPLDLESVIDLDVLKKIYDVLSREE